LESRQYEGAEVVKDSTLTLMALLSITGGSMGPIFFIFCVNQLTSLMNRTSNIAIQTARFTVGKYLTAMAVVGVSTVAFLSSGFVLALEIMEREDKSTDTHVFLPIDAVVGLFSYAIWCLVLIVALLTLFEYVEYRIEMGAMLEK
jgi:hypothetical protein